MNQPEVKERLQNVRRQYKPSCRTWLRFSNTGGRIHTYISDNEVGFTINNKKIHTAADLDKLAADYEKILVEEANAVVSEDAAPENDVAPSEQNLDGSEDNQVKPHPKRRRKGAKRLTAAVMAQRRADKGRKRQGGK